MSCQKARGFLEKHAIAVKDSVDAVKERQGRDEALALARTVRTIHIARGKNIVTIDMKKDAPDDDTLAGYLLGPTGNLRAPTIRHGQALYVGFHEDAYRQLAGR